MKFKALFLFLTVFILIPGADPVMGKTPTGKTLRLVYVGAISGYLQLCG